MSEDETSRYPDMHSGRELNPGSDTKRPRIAVLTHNFPRYPSDIAAIGFQPLFRVLQRDIDLEFVAPHDIALAMHESFNGFSVNRFRYGSDSAEVLAYRGEMHKRILRHPLTARRFFSSFKAKSLEVIQSNNCTSIWAHWWIPGGMIAAGLSKRLNLPLVVTCHGTDIHLIRKFSWLRPAARRVFNQARAVTVVSDFLKQTLIASLGDRDGSLESRITVAPLIVDKAKVYYDPEVVKKPGSIIYAARYTHQKNIDVAIKAIGNLKRSGINCTLDIVGDGPIKDELTRLVADLGLGDRVKFHEPLVQVKLADMFRRSEVALLVSEREGFGLTLMEAMMCGCVGIGARSGGILDIIKEPEREGILVEPRNVEQLTNALAQVLTNSERMRQLAETGRKAVTARFSDTELAERFLAQLR